MFTELGRAQLQTGEPITLAAVTGPDPEWAPRLRALLGHKGPTYRWHIEQALERPLDDLETIFYVGLVGGVPVTVSVVTGGHGAGVYAHVYTVPDWRRRGASGHLHAVVAPDTARRGYRALSLGTNPEGHARRLYEGIGYRQLAPGRGDMAWTDGSEPVPAEVGLGTLRWGDWGWVSAACCAPLADDEALPRSQLFHVRDRGHVESAFIEAMRSEVPVAVLRAGDSAVGWRALLRDPARAMGAWTLELYVRPGFRAHTPRLMEGVEWPSRPVVCANAGPAAHGDGGDYRGQALRGADFRPAARLERWWDVGRGTEALVLWARP